MSLVIRFSGGAQCGHRVVTPDGRSHVFSQFGSGTFSGAHTHLSRYMFVNPLFMLSEEKHLREVGVTNAFDLVTVDKDAVITTPFHVATNRLKELYRNKGKHGSCGMGIGETMHDFLQFEDAMPIVGDMVVPSRMYDKLHFIQKLKREEIYTYCVGLQKTPLVERELSILEDEEVVQDCMQQYLNAAPLFHSVSSGYIEDQLNCFSKAYLVVGLGYGDEGKGKVVSSLINLNKKCAVFEGAQGVLLDQDFGFQPYATWTDTTFGNALKLLRGYKGRIVRMGVIRPYMTRHGAGPFVSEDRNLIYQDHNQTGLWQGEFRFGRFDLVALNYALQVLGPVDEVAMTHLDQITGQEPVCIGYKVAEENTDFFICQEGIVSEIKIRRPFDLVYQEQLAKVLFRTQPVFGSQVMSSTFIGGGFGVGVSVTLKSYGPTFENVMYREVQEC